MGVAHIGLAHRDPCECKVKDFRVVFSIERNISKEALARDVTVLDHSPLEHLFQLKKIGRTHLRSKRDNFSLKASPFEQMWCQLLAIQLPQIYSTQTFKFFYKLLLQNIYEIKHITLPNGTTLMSQEDFKNFYATPTKLMKQELNIVEKLFCHPRYNPNCQNPCANHHLPCTLKEE